MSNFCRQLKKAIKDEEAEQGRYWNIVEAAHQEYGEDRATEIRVVIGKIMDEENTHKEALKYLYDGWCERLDLAKPSEAIGKLLGERLE